MVPPIKLCTNGHNICSKCRESVQCCPTCRAKFSKIRNVALENIARKLKYPCVNRQRGCPDWFSIEHINEHHAACVYGKIKCPLHLRKKCSWKGLKNNLKEHVKAAHPKYYREVSTFRCPKLSWSLGILYCFGELFTCYLQKRDGRYYCAVQLIGTSSEASKYKCEFTLRAENGIEQISKTFLVQGYSENFETIFNSGICLCLDEKTVKHFVKENKLKLSGTLSRV
jgi:E3 ubiquitin-protein ligase SIAH1